MIAIRSQQPQVEPDLLTSRQVAEHLSMSVRTVWRLVASGKFPAPIRYNRKLVRWKADEVARHLERLRPGS
ncbi:MAG: helix-turn-helix transcriptional regulator [Gemmataceae bacterium]